MHLTNNRELISLTSNRKRVKIAIHSKIYNIVKISLKLVKTNIIHAIVVKMKA